MTVPSFIYRWQASPDEVAPTRNGWEISHEMAKESEFLPFLYQAPRDIPVKDLLPFTAAEAAQIQEDIRTLARQPAPPTLRVARFAWALGSAPAVFNFPPFVSAWRPWKRPWDWERDGC